MTTNYKCQTCPNGVGLARGVATVPGRNVLVVTIVCQKCGNRWTVEQVSASRIPRSDDVSNPAHEK
jgi:C4-type Zn-finger protein